MGLLPEEAAAHEVAHEELRGHEVLDGDLHRVHAPVVPHLLQLVALHQDLQHQEAHGVDQRGPLHDLRRVAQHPSDHESAEGVAHEVALAKAPDLDNEIKSQS